jgi:ABC-2 type transport system permease protein
LVLVGAWTAVAAFVPSAYNFAVGSFDPPPSRLAFINELRRATLDARRDGTRLLDRFYDAHPDLSSARPAPGEFDFGKAYLMVTYEHEKVSKPLEASLDDYLERQQRRAETLGWFLPPAAAHEVLLLLAGTDVRRYLDFRRQVASFREAWQQALRPRVLAGHWLGANEFPTLPAFTFRDRPQRAVAIAVVRQLCGISLASAVLAVSVGVRLRRTPA